MTLRAHELFDGVDDPGLVDKLQPERVAVEHTFVMVDRLTVASVVAFEVFELVNLPAGFGGKLGADRGRQKRSPVFVHGSDNSVDVVGRDWGQDGFTGLRHVLFLLDLAGF